jgi:hypothetical protein
MYVLIILVLLLIAPLTSIYLEGAYFHSSAPLLFLVGKWFTFWAAGVRLSLAGLRQTVQPGFTAREIFEFDSKDVFPLVREIGFGNIAMGSLALATIFRPDWLLPGAFVGGLYYGLAGLMHLFAAKRNLNEAIAMVSDIAIALILLVFFGLSV